MSAGTLHRALHDSPLDRASAGLDACVHCGFCLPACPTYLALEDENDSPRGRLVLMRALLDGHLAPDDPTAGTHLDRCLGCRGCETACPAGVPYGELLEATRATLVPHRPLPRLARVVLAVFAREWLLRPTLAVARVIRALGVGRIAAHLLPARLAMPAAMLDATARPPTAGWRAHGNGRRGTATLLTGCVMEGLFTPVNRATERVLTVNGYRMVDTPGQVCCGALHAHAGDAENARALARENIAAFGATGAAAIAVNSAGCGAMCRGYGHLLAHDRVWAARAAAFSARVRDVHELLADAGPLAAAATGTPTVVAWDAPCHLEHAQRVVAPPLTVLGAIGDVAVTPLPESDQCCGSAGIFSLVQPEVAAAVLRPKLERIAESGATVLATANPGCLMQIGGGLRLAGSTVVTRHPVELLDKGYAAQSATR